MFTLVQPCFICMMMLLLSGCAGHRGMILPLPNGQWAIRSQCATWAIGFPVRDLTKVSHKVSPDGEHIYIHLATGSLNISLWMEPINNSYCSSAQCAIAAKLKTDKSIMVAQFTETFDVETQQHEHFASVEYFLKTWPTTLPTPVEGMRAGDEINQLNVAAVLFKEGYWADIHISTAGLDVGGEKLENSRKSFRTILANTRVIPQQSECH